MSDATPMEVAVAEAASGLLRAAKESEVLRVAIIIAAGRVIAATASVADDPQAEIAELLEDLQADALNIIATPRPRHV